MSTNQDMTLRTLRDQIEARYGLAYPDSQLPVLAARLERVLPKLGCRSIGDVHQALKADSDFPSDQLVAALTIGETYFLRNRSQFEALRHQVLPDLMRRLGTAPLTIWSAGCATGEEPYSLAMWIREYQPELLPHRLRIVATDLNSEFLARARQGRYRGPSFRQLENHWRKKYFSSEGSDQVIDEGLRRVVSFKQHNLVSGALPEGMLPGQVGIVFCRNVFIYFSIATSRSVLELFRQALMPDGVLVLGHAEPLTTLRNWRNGYYPGAFYYHPPRKDPVPVCEETDQVSASPRQPRRPAVQPAGTTRPSTTQSEKKAREFKTPRIESLSAGTMMHRARELADAGQLAEARHILLELTSRHKTSVEGHFLCAMVAEQLGDWNAARESLKKTLFLDKQLVLAHYLLAVLEERREDLKAALRRYGTVCRLLDKTASESELAFGDGIRAGRLRELAEARLVELAGND